jgi:hypothetical protein
MEGYDVWMGFVCYDTVASGHSATFESTHLFHFQCGLRRLYLMKQ